jgi:hypothetical protein
MRTPWMMEALFTFLWRTCRIQWSAREWTFRVKLDLWIVYVGMLTAIAVNKARDHRLTDHPRWPVLLKISLGGSCIAMAWFFGFELLQESKFVYNRWHPYISFIPVVAFVMLRNATSALRSASSRIFMFVGRCSLETFIIQYHLWLAGDTKGILIVIPGARWWPINFLITTIMFVFVSDRMASATGDITSSVCGKGPKSIAAPGEPSSDYRATPQFDEENQLSIPLSTLNPARTYEGGDLLGPRSAYRRWISSLQDTLSRLTPLSLWKQREFGLKTKLTITFFLMWIANILW